MVQKAAVHVDGVRRWLAFEDTNWDNTSFETIGGAFEKLGEYNKSEIGNASLATFRSEGFSRFCGGLFSQQSGSEFEPTDELDRCDRIGKTMAEAE